MLIPSRRSGFAPLGDSLQTPQSNPVITPLRATAYLDHAATSFPKPPSVIAAMQDFLCQVGASAGRGSYAETDEAAALLGQTRRELGALLGATDPRRIIFTLNATGALNLALKGCLKPGSHVVTSDVEHNSVLRPVNALANTLGVTVSRVPANAAGEYDVSGIERLIRPETRLLVFQHGSNVSGAIQPIAAVSAIARAYGIPLLVDAAQTAGSVPLNVDKEGLDLVAVPGHKGLLGPLGTGALIVREGLELATVTEGGTGSASEWEHQPDAWPDRHEAGSHNMPGICGLLAGVRVVEGAGVPSVRAHKQLLVSALLRGLGDIRGIRVVGQTDAALNAGVVCIVLAGHDPGAFAVALDRRFRVSARAGLHCAPGAHRAIGSFPAGAVRLSVGISNSLDEVERAVDAVASLAQRGTSFRVPEVDGQPCLHAATPRGDVHRRNSIPLPVIIQGGMGVAVSGWRLASAVSRSGQLGVVSGTALDQVMVRRLQQGDSEGHIRRAIAKFPDQSVAARVLERYFVPGGRPLNASFVSAPMFRVDSPVEHQEINVLASFVEVWLARDGHEGLVGINLLEKVQLPNLTALYGAMLAGVDYVLIGAGIPWQIPGALESLAMHARTALRVTVDDERDGVVEETLFEPQSVVLGKLEPLRRPKFLAIVSSSTLAQALVKRASGPVDGFVVEHASAGGHNAPPRGPARRTPQGELHYGERDAIDHAQFRELGLPFWLAGGYGSAEQLAAARREGAQGVQVGTAFAFCEESGLAPRYRAAILQSVREGNVRIFTDPAASPTGFPFKVVELPDTLSDPEAYAARARICDLGFLRRAYRRVDGTLGYRCSAEPHLDYVRKGGSVADTEGRKCLCNALLANIGLGQRREGGEPELACLTAGDDLSAIGRFIPPGASTYHAGDVLDILLAGNHHE